MKRVLLYSCMLMGGVFLSLPSAFADAVKSDGEEGKKQNAEEKKQTYSDREMSEATLKAMITLAGQITKALSEVKDKKSAEDCIAKLEIIRKVKDKIQAHTAKLAPPDMETSKAIMNEFGPRLQEAFTTLNKEVLRIQKDKYYSSLEFRTALENLLNAPATGMPVI